MKDKQSSNVFIQMTKLFGDLSEQKPKKQRSAVPRMTCTRLKKFRESKNHAAIEAEFELNSELTQTGSLADDLISKKESFAEWIVRNQQAHQQAIQEAANKANHSHDEIKTVPEKEANKTVQGFTNFSSEALQEVAKNPETPIITLKWLAASYDVKVREALATNNNIGNDILHILARDGEDSVKEAVLDNENIAQEEIIRLCEESNSLVSDKAKNLLKQKSKPKINRHWAMDATANIDVSTARAIRRNYSALPKTSKNIA